MMTTDGEHLLLCVENTRILNLIRKPRALAEIPAGTIIGPVIEVVKILDKYGTEVAIQSISNPENTSYVVISTETDRFVNENS